MLVALAAPALAADPAQEVWEVIERMARALGQGSSTEFLAACDPLMPGYSTLRTNVAALIAAAEVESGIDPVSNEGDGVARHVEVDWSLNLVDRTGLQKATRRQQTVKIGMEKRAKKWRVVSLDPVAFFGPPSAGVNLAHERRAGVLLR